jgi:hypothetical protein
MPCFAQGTGANSGIINTASGPTTQGATATGNNSIYQGITTQQSIPNLQKTYLGGGSQGNTLAPIFGTSGGSMAGTSSGPGGPGWNSCAGPSGSGCGGCCGGGCMFGCIAGSLAGLMNPTGGCGCFMSAFSCGGSCAGGSMFGGGCSGGSGCMGFGQ